MRTVWPSIILQFVQQWDDILKKLFATSIGVSTADLSMDGNLPWDVARLHAADGGMGIYYLEDRVHAAFVASVISSMEVIMQKNPEIKDIIVDQVMEEKTNGHFNFNCTGKKYDSTPRTIKELLQSITFLRDNGIKLQGEAVSLENLTQLESKQFKHLQAVLTEGFRRKRSAEATEKMNSDQIIIFQSGASGPAGAYTDMIPTDMPQSRMDNGQWHNSGRRRCLVRDTANAGTQCVCKSRSKLDSNHIHMQTCAVAGGPGRNETHDDVKFCIVSMLNGVGLKATVETLVQKGKNKKRMDIVLNTLNAPGFQAAIIDMDVTVVNAMTSKAKNTSANNATLNDAVAKKERKYNEDSRQQGHKFISNTETNVDL